MKRRIIGGAVAASLLVTAIAVAAPEVFRAPVKLREVSSSLWSEPFKGVTTNGKVVPGLFALAQTGVSTAPVSKAANMFVASLNESQRKKTLFPVDDSEWRQWDNRHFAMRQGAQGDPRHHEPQRHAGRNDRQL
jgi:hypothetical protein